MADTYDVPKTLFIASTHEVMQRLNSHFTDEKTEAQRDLLTCSSSQAKNCGART